MPSASKNSSKVVYEWLWACCHCGGHSAMAVESTLACPGCGYFRCEYCPLESIARRIDRKRYRTDKQLEPTARTWILPVSHMDSPVSTSSSPKGGIFTPPPNSPESNTDTELEETDSQASHEDELAVSYEAHALNVLEARLRSLLDDDLSLVAQLVPKVFYASRQSLQDNSTKNIPIITTSKTSKGISHGQSGAGSTSTSTSCKSNEGASSSLSTSLKRSFGSDASDEGRKPNHSPPGEYKKLKPLSDDKILKFACHYHKLDPGAHDPRVDRKFRSCPAPSVRVGELRRIKEHFEYAHGPLYCERCSQKFKKGSALIDHCSSQGCTETPVSLENGISSAKWMPIHSHVKAFRGLAGEQREKHEYDKWFDVWDVLFPGIPRPEHPFTDDPSCKAPRFRDVRSLLNRLEQIISSDIRGGILRVDDHVHQHYLSAVELAYNAHIMDNNEPPVLSAPTNHGRQSSIATPGISLGESNEEEPTGILADINLNNSNDITMSIQPSLMDLTQRVDDRAKQHTSPEPPDFTGLAPLPELPGSVFMHSNDTSSQSQGSDTNDQNGLVVQGASLGSDQFWGDFLEPDYSAYLEFG